ncbi:hypothetical protein L195_g039578, partial [Trifolium pratense]
MTNEDGDIERRRDGDAGDDD